MRGIAMAAAVLLVSALLPLLTYWQVQRAVAAVHAEYAVREVDCARWALRNWPQAPRGHKLKDHRHDHPRDL